MTRRPSLPPSSAASRGSIPAMAGIGLRFAHHRQVAEQCSASARPIAWMEVHAENYLGGGSGPAMLDRIRRDRPISLHGVGLSLGSADGLDETHLAHLQQAVMRFDPCLVSEHLSWSTVNGIYLADLIPLPMTEEALDVVCGHVTRVQEALSRTILVENPSSYVQYAHSPIPEWEFLTDVVARTGCGILCDVNNIFVSASNHGWDPIRYLDGLPAKAVGEIHLAGHSMRDISDGKNLLIDDHGARVSDAVWALYAEALRRFGPVPTLIEWDTNIPALEILIDEAATAQSYLNNFSAEVDHANAA